MLRRPVRVGGKPAGVGAHGSPRSLRPRAGHRRDPCVHRPLQHRQRHRALVEHDAVDVTGMPVRERNVAMVYQQFINYPSMSVADNIASPLMLLDEPLVNLDYKLRAVRADRRCLPPAVVGARRARPRRPADEPDRRPRERRRRFSGLHWPAAWACSSRCPVGAPTRSRSACVPAATAHLRRPLRRTKAGKGALRGAAVRAVFRLQNS